MRNKNFNTAFRAHFMYSDKFQTFIKIWQQEFAIEKTIDDKVCVDKSGRPLPWYTYPAIEYLDQFDYAAKRVFEYGCGSSSLFWAGRALSVTGVEDNPQWFAKWQKALRAPNLEILLRDESEKYENAIFETEHNFDIIVIDGKRREKCCAAAVQKLSPGGMIILDDSDRINTSREYAGAVAELKKADLLQIDFFGFCPMNNYTKATSLFLRRDFNFQSRHKTQPTNGIGNLWSQSRKARKEFYRRNN